MTKRQHVHFAVSTVLATAGVITMGVGLAVGSIPTLIAAVVLAMLTAAHAESWADAKESRS